MCASYVLETLPLKGCDADSIVTMIVKFFKSIEVDLAKMVMFTSDGAAVLLGCNNGVFVKLRGMSVPHSTEHHCVAHKEALADGSAYQSSAYFVELENVIKAIYSHFSHSSVKIANLKSLFGVLEQKYIKVEKVNDSSPISVSLKKVY